MKMTPEQIRRLVSQLKITKGDTNAVVTMELLKSFNDRMTTIKGEPGLPGATPVRGVDYFTPAEIQSVALEIIKYVEAGITVPKDGYVPVAGKDYPTIPQIAGLVQAAVDKAVAAVEISMPEDGQPGDAGEPGQTPVKGVDYFTPADVEAMVKEVIAKVPRIVETRALPNISLIGRSGGRSFEVVDSNGVNLGQAVRKLQLGSGLTGTIVGDGVLKITGAGGSGITGTASFDETPGGSIDDSNATFTLAHTPAQTQFPLALYLNGARQRAGGVDFTLSGGTITFVTPPASGSTMWADYYY